MTRDEIKNTPEIVDYLLDESVIADSRKKLHERMDKICNLAIKALEQQLCEDCISKQTVKEQMIKYGFSAPDMTVTEFVEGLPLVDTQPKTGHWIYGEDLGTGRDGWFCSKCGHFEFWDYSFDSEVAKLHLPNFCPDCGAKMVEPRKGAIRNDC